MKKKQNTVNHVIIGRKDAIISFAKLLVSGCSYLGVSTA